jgi:uncharacterized membrane protein
MKKLSVLNIVYIGLLAAITIVATFIGITIPIGGGAGALVHFGTAVATISLLVFGKRTGTYSSTIGMSLFDLMGGWATWMPGTFIARLAYGYLVGKFSYDKKNNLRSTKFQIIGITLGGIALIIIYYIWEVILYQQPIAALGSIPANVLQVVFAIVVGIPVANLLNRNMKIEKY